ncbi:prolyl-tRNA synthetase [Monoraphidium neglectum]|uniref:proline--tRNA ligase n=1 Tax=Monoraphidium neglectum TaxID=145388 RepID=A0A0D2J508_9CHLO|nr:prolyl-tRNA synthetase [Monoraphidium neglectum]KIY95002.1 prolyl-tRNA synthetase [Monoraphidium neglectum]|eukprot:XP_013894022.1 prolyl-tRNA synthetase [Monoraphidium neglectum]
MACGLPSGALQGVALAHGDAAGIRLPPALAPVQVVIVPVPKGGGGGAGGRAALAAEAERLRGELQAAGVRAEVDGRSCVPGAKFGSSERRGVPLRIEFDTESVASRTCVISKRDEPGPAAKLRDVSTEPGALAAAVIDLLDDAQLALRWRSAAALQSEVVDVSSYWELRDAIEAGKWARGPWAGGADDEAAVLREAGAALVCIPLEQPSSLQRGWTTCLYTGYQATEVAVFARAAP